MVDFASLRATAKRLIDENGKTVTIQRLANVPSSDDQKPWRAEERPIVAKVVGAGIFVSDKGTGRGGVAWSLVREMVDGMKSDNSVVLFAAANDNGENLEGFDEILEGSNVWRIIKVELLQPSTDKILYAFEIVRK